MRLVFWFFVMLLCSSFVLGDVVINEFLADPLGKDNVPMPGGEWIELHNTGSVVDLDGWYFKDKSNRRVYISDVTTYDTEIDDYLVVYMNGFSGLLNNDGFEVVELYDSSDDLVDSVSYDNSYEAIGWSKVGGRWIKARVTPGSKNYDYLPEEESSIEIEKVYVGSDDVVKFGDIVRVRVRIYKGGTSRYAVYAKIDGLSKRTQVNLENKYTNYTVVLPIQVLPNCNYDLDSGSYTLEVEGLGASDSSRIEVDGVNSDTCEKVSGSVVGGVGKKKFEYSVLNIPNSVKPGDVFESTIVLKNNYNKEMQIRVWSYVYRGSKTYSGSRESNLKSFFLGAGEEKEVGLVNVLDKDVEEGQYKLKFKINKDGQKTNQELTENLNVVSELKCPVCSCVSNGVVVEKMENEVDLIGGGVVYESTSEVSMQSVPVFVSLVGLLGIFVYRKV
jgi:hypothetical protein